MRNKNRLFGGYMSVEASFVVIWSFAIIIILIYAAFFMYNRCLLFQDGYSIAVSTASRNASVQQQQSWLNANINKQYGNKYIASEYRKTSGKVSAEKIMVVSNLRMRMNPVDGWLVGQKKHTASDSVSCDNYSFVKKLRHLNEESAE